MTTIVTCLDASRRYDTELRKRAPLVRRGLRLIVLLAMLYLSLVGTMALIRDPGAAAGRAADACAAPMVGVFTGEFADGVPVYRLPAITISATRTLE